MKFPENSISSLPSRIRRGLFPRTEWSGSLPRRSAVSFLAVFLLFTAGMGVAGLVYYTAQKAHLRTATLDELSTIADLKVQGIARWRQERALDALISTRNPLTAQAIRSWLNDPSDERLRAQLTRWLGNLRNNREYRSTMLLDARGAVRLALPEGATADREVVGKALSTPRGSEPTFLGFRRTDPGGKIALFLSASVADPERPAGPPIGFLLLNIDPSEFLYPYIQSWPTPSSTGETMLVERQGADAVYLNELRHKKGTALVLRRSLSDRNRTAAQAVLAGWGTTESTDYAGVPVLGSFRQIPGTPWVLVAKLAKDEAYSPLRQNVRLLAVSTGALVFGAAITLLSVAGWQIARQESRVTRALRESEARFKAFTSNLPAAAWIKDVDGRYLYANAEAEKSFSKPLHVILGNTDEGLFPPETARGFRENDRRALDQGSAVRTIEVMEKADGTVQTMIVSKFSIPGTQSPEPEVAGVSFDISDRLRMEEQLRESEQRLRLAQKVARSGTFEWNIQTGVNRWTQELEAIYGLPPGRFPGTQEAWEELIYPEDRAEILARVARALEQGDFQGEWRVLLPDGTVRWIAGRAQVLKDEGGKPLRFVGINIDITERKAAEEALRASEAQFRSLAESLPQLVWMADADGSVDYVNQGWLDYTGAASQEALGDGWLATLHPEDREPTRARWLHSIGTGAVYEVEYRVRRASDGAYRWYLGRALPLRDEEGQVVRWFGTCTDIEDQKRAQEAQREAREAAETASRAKSDFLANMSHEIRTPMNGILGVTELLLETDLPLAQRQYVDMIKSSAEALLTVVNDILDFSKIEAGATELDRVEFDLHDVVEKTAETLAVRAHQKGLELSADLDPDIPEFFLGDPGRLRQVLMNLVSNAIKFTDRGEVVVQVSGAPSEGGRWRLRFAVTDTGIGIPEGKMDLLFKSFTQLDPSRTRLHGGTGLGLSISKSFVEQMGGRIWGESREGEGSTFAFEIELPKVDRVREEAAPPEELAGLRALVLDDNRTNRVLLERALTGNGIVVELASRGREAIDKLLEAAREGRAFDLALLDLHLPDMDGFEVAAELQRHLPLGKLAILMITSDDVAGGARRARELGVVAYIVKPVRLRALLEALRRVRAAADAAETIEVRGGAGEGELFPSIPPGTRVLVVEDNPVNLTVVEAQLRKAGARVTSARNGLEALEAFEAGDFDVVLMDVQMPEMDGLEATRRLRQRGLRVPIICLTAHAMEGDREKCLSAGVDDYLPKPVSAEHLSRTIARWVRGKGPVQEAPRPPAKAPAGGFSALLEKLGGDRAVLRTLCAQLRASIEELMPQIGRAVEDGDEEKLQRAAHKLRGGLLVFEADEAVELTREFETLGTGRRTEGAQGLYEKLKAATDRLLELVSAELRA